VSARTYFVGNRIWWAGALFLAPIVAVGAGSPVAGVVAAAILVLPAFVLFDTDRGWWSNEVRVLPHDKERSRKELRLLDGLRGPRSRVGPRHRVSHWIAWRRLVRPGLTALPIAGDPARRRECCAVAARLDHA
jgi:hypothetical protein